jgi:IS5 family transposase
MRRFARVELGDDIVPDESTILRFRSLLEQHQLTATIIEAVRDLLVELGAPMMIASTVRTGRKPTDRRELSDIGVARIGSGTTRPTAAPDATVILVQPS